MTPPLAISASTPRGTEPASERSGEANGSNRLAVEDRAAHRWYRFVLSFPPHLVRDYLKKLSLGPGDTVLDPFCGTGTTLVECKKLGISSIGIEANPMAHFASMVKTDWRADGRALARHAREVASRADEKLSGLGTGAMPSGGLFSHDVPGHLNLLALPKESMGLLLGGSISPLPLHRALVLLDLLKGRDGDGRFFRHELLALAKGLVTTIGNLHFGPEVGVGSPKEDAPVVGDWLSNVNEIAEDLGELGSMKDVPSAVNLFDSRRIHEVVKPDSVDGVITSPPYPNEKDYTRTTRLESVLLGFVGDKSQLRAFKRTLIRSNTRNVYKGDDEDKLVADIPEIRRIAEEIESRRIAMGKTSGFERQYARVAKLYFGGMAKHLAEMRAVLRPGARLAYVVGDQASYLRVMIRTGQILAKIADGLGYEVGGVDLFRTRLATATREQLREEVVLLRWPGEHGHKGR